MPISRNHRSRNLSVRDRRRRRRERASAGGDTGRTVFTIGGDRPVSSLENFLTGEDRRHFEWSAEAAARGDAEAALHHLMAGAVVVGSPLPHQLRELALLGDEAPPWAYSRWCVGQAYRWLLLVQDPRTTLAVLDTIAAAYPDADPDRPFGVERVEFGTRVAAGDWICQQLAVHEYDGLLDFLDVRAEDGLLSRTDRVRSWATARMGAFRLDHLVGDRLVLTDLATRGEVEALNIGAATDRRLGAYLLGRLVPVSVEPGSMFESRPVEIDATTAGHVALSVREGDPLGWLDAVEVARRQGRLAPYFSTGQTTLLTSDIVPERWAVEPERAGRPARRVGGPDEEDDDGAVAARLAELRAAGLDDLQANGVMVAEVALLVAEASPQAAAAVGPHLAVVLVEPRVRAAVRRHCTAPEDAPAWSLLAHCTPEPARSRCRELAEQSARADRRAC